MNEINGQTAHIDVTADTADELVSALSRSRLMVVGLGATHMHDRLYAHARNIALCEALYPVLHVLEITLRNRIHDAFSLHYGSEEWFRERWLRPGHRHLVRQACEKIAMRGGKPDTNAVVAALTFGFWCGMFSDDYECRNGPWPAVVKMVVPYAPKSWRTRSRIAVRIQGARALRNRVFHHVPIVHRSDLGARHRALMELLGWLSNGAREHVEDICRFRDVLSDSCSSRPVANETESTQG